MSLQSVGLALLDFISRPFSNRVRIDFAISRERKRRPHPFSLWTGSAMPAPAVAPTPYNPDPMHPPMPFVPSNYVSWPGLVDRTFTGRHLPPADAFAMKDLPDPERVFETIFLRKGEMRPCKSTSALFCFFAQWFTDSFLRTHPLDRRRNTSNHEIDFCQIYGLDEDTTFALRARRDGLMATRIDDKGRELLPLLVTADDAVDPYFRGLSYIDDMPGQPLGKIYRERIEASLKLAPSDPARWRSMYATGLDRGNSTIFYTALSTMCVREHNRIARQLRTAHPDWDDDRLFETARMINLHHVLEIVVEDYINHIAGDHGFRLDASFAERRPWYRTNRISLEFNLLYRWHSLVPDTVDAGGAVRDHLGFRFNNQVLEQSSPEALINAASAQSAGRIGLYNTPEFLRHAEMSSIRMGREFRLQSFNAYRERFRERPYESIEALVGGDARAAKDLRDLYGDDVNRVEFMVGLFAEARSKDNVDAVLPPLLRTMVAVDAFTHILTNPILSAQVRETVFSGDLAPFVKDAGGVTGLMARNSTSGGPIAMPRFAVR